MSCFYSCIYSCHMFWKCLIYSFCASASYKIPMIRGEIESTNVALTWGWGRVHEWARGWGLAKGIVLPRGQTKSTTLEPDYEPEGPTNLIPPSPPSDATLLIQELLLRVFARLERAHPAPATIDAPISTTLVSIYIAPSEPTMIYVGLFAAPTYPPMTGMILPKTSRPSLSSQF